MSDRLIRALSENDKIRDAARPAGGSLGATMNQGGSYSHPSSDTLPELMNQGPSDLRGNQSKAKPLRSLLNQ